MRLFPILATVLVLSTVQPATSQRDGRPRHEVEASSPQREVQPPARPGVQPGVDGGYGYDPYGYGPPPIDYTPPPSPTGPLYRGATAVGATADGGGTVSTVMVGGTPAFLESGQQRAAGTPGASVVSTATVPGFDAPPPPRQAKRRSTRQRPR